MKRFFSKLTSLGGVVSLCALLFVFYIAISAIFGEDSRAYPHWALLALKLLCLITFLTAVFGLFKSLKPEKRE